MQKSIVVELVWLRLRFEKWMEWNCDERVWRGEKRASTNVLCICVVFCCWDLQLNWSVGGDEVAVAGIVGGCGEKCWTKGRVQGIFGFLSFSRINFLRDLFVAARRNCCVVSGIG